MKKLLVLVLASFSISIAQEPIDEKQLMFGVTGVLPNEIVTHTISAQGIVWELQAGINWIKSLPADPQLNPLYFNSVESEGNVDPNSSGWYAAFNFKWRQPPTPLYPSWGLGLYKISNSKNPDKYFYLDARESKYGSGGGIDVDIHIWYDHTTNKYKYRKLGVGWIQVDNDGDVVSVWEIKNREYFKPNLLEDYWVNVLVLVNDGQDHPRLIWAPYPSLDFGVNYYKIYKRKQSPNFALLTTTTIEEFIDYDEVLITGPPQGNETSAEYRITAVGMWQDTPGFETGPTNIVRARVEGEIPWKIGTGYHNIADQINYPKLDQNYPNPFNPTTTIKISLPEDSDVSLKIYDVLGREIAVLLNNYLEAGDYSVYFDLSTISKDISSGVYLYKLTTENQILARKMIIAK